MRVTILTISLAISVIFSSAAFGASSCARECSADYRTDVWTCHTIGADDAIGGHQDCVQAAGDDYDTCLRDCLDPLQLNLAP